MATDTAANANRFRIPAPLLDRGLSKAEDVLDDVVGPDGIKIDTKVALDTTTAFDPLAWAQANPGKTAIGAGAVGLVLWRIFR